MGGRAIDKRLSGWVSGESRVRVVASGGVDGEGIATDLPSASVHGRVVLPVKVDAVQVILDDEVLGGCTRLGEWTGGHTERYKQTSGTAALMEGVGSKLRTAMSLHVSVTSAPAEVGKSVAPNALTMILILLTGAAEAIVW